MDTAAWGTSPEARRPRRPPADEVMAAAVASLYRLVAATEREPYQFTLKWGRRPEITAIVSGPVDVAYAEALFDACRSEAIDVGPPYGPTEQRNATAYVPSWGVTLTVVVDGRG